MASSELSKFTILPNEIKQKIFYHALELSKPTNKFQVPHERIYKIKCPPQERLDTAISLTLVDKSTRQLMVLVVALHLLKIRHDYQFYASLLPLTWLSRAKAMRDIYSLCTQFPELIEAEQGGEFAQELAMLPLSSKDRKLAAGLYATVETRVPIVRQLWSLEYNLWYEAVAEFGLLYANLSSEVRYSATTHTLLQSLTQYHRANNTSKNTPTPSASACPTPAPVRPLAVESPGTTPIGGAATSTRAGRSSL